MGGEAVVLQSQLAAGQVTKDALINGRESAFWAITELNDSGITRNRVTGDALPSQLPPTALNGCKA